MTKREIELGMQLALVLGALKALADSYQRENEPLLSMINRAEDVLRYQEPEHAGQENQDDA
jgi:hypothetical protein